MMRALKFILQSQLKRSKVIEPVAGFSLIELLVAMILAVLVITPLFGFMISVMNTDRQEQAKATTEQEIQAALDYIARDLQQAVYIYDADGITRNRNTTTIASSGIRDQIPPVKSAPNCSPTSASNPSVCTPILVFWKREFVADSVRVSSAADSEKDDGFAYSLVAYYLITNPNSANSKWSPSARIGRFELRGPVNATYSSVTAQAGFNPPPLSESVIGSTLKEKMNQWQSSLDETGSYTQRVETLVDFISTTGPAITTNTAGVCPGTNASPKLVGSLTSGFFACIDTSQVVAQVYLRGNAFARLYNHNNITFTNTVSTYFPSASIRVQGRGFLFTN
ncbi:hormogonium polysaccharide secretion pseudopilin HpsC [Anabaena sp. CA = ATCC 33047]|uniref:hormogonium polysaccharide secretion pseudopilin HpsC n=1 Tax=Anabaena sp. (strain CA / ATCC 33047) TaxID=52271 RepID=UPI000836A95F|nr:hormogonium polysaccharide secretion pseudopilin HpsC [Anabaena sp. CA = ATCC 33047]